MLWLLLIGVISKQWHGQAGKMAEPVPLLRH
jgi:hypothetical protein